jgi:predicted transcriptional regulator
MPKTEFLQIRCSPEDRERIRRVAEAEHLEVSTWARRALLQAVERWESRQPGRLKVAESASERFSGRPDSKKR